MKKLCTLTIVLMLLSAQYVMGQKTVKDAYPRLNMPQEKEQQLLNAAKDLCVKFAPDFDLTKLTPVITEFRELTKYDRKAFPPAYADRKLAVIYFMSDTIRNYGTFMHHNEATGKDEYLRRPVAELQTIICLDNMEPVGILGEYGVIFRPNYETFCKENPNYRVPKAKAVKDNSETLTVNELAKKELEEKGYKNVRIGE